MKGINEKTQPPFRGYAREAAPTPSFELVVSSIPVMRQTLPWTFACIELFMEFWVWIREVTLLTAITGGGLISRFCQRW